MRTVGPEMIPIVGSKIYVNTQTKILALNINNLHKRKLNHRKESKRKNKWFILVLSLWPSSSPQATRLRFSFIFWLCTPKIKTLYPIWLIPFAKCIQLFLQPRRPQHLVQSLFNPKTLLYNPSLWVNYNQSYKPWICVWSWTRALIGRLLEIFTME